MGIKLKNDRMQNGINAISTKTRLFIFFVKSLTKKLMSQKNMHLSTPYLKACLFLKRSNEYNKLKTRKELANMKTASQWMMLGGVAYVIMRLIKASKCSYAP